MSAEWKNMQDALMYVNVHVQGPPGQKGDQGATEIIDYNGNIQDALQVRHVMLIFPLIICVL